MPTNTQFNPKKNSDFNKDDMEFGGDSISFSCSPSSEAYSDLLLIEDHILDGGILLVEGGNIKDRIFFEIVHPQYGVIKQFIKNYGVSKDSFQISLVVGYPSKLFAGLAVRCRYIANENPGTREILINLRLHKVMN